MNKRFKFWCKGTSTNGNFNKPGWWTFPNYLLQKYYPGLSIFESPDFEAVQYTGLLDKDGKEIYEGDLLLQEQKNYDNETYLVKWYTADAMFECDPQFSRRDGKFAPKSFCILSVCHGQSEVIGNKFENPNLLKHYEN